MSAAPTFAHDLARGRSLTGAAPLREILVPSDLCPASDRALDHARMLAQRFDSHLTLYHVVEVPQRDYASWATEQADAVWPAARREAFRELSRRGGTPRVRHEVVVEQALSTHRALVAYVRSQRPDLVVNGHAGPRRALASAARQHNREGATARPPAPALRPRPGEPGTLPYRRLLVPTDLSPASRKAFPLAGLLARALRAAIIVLHVAPLSPLPNLSGLPLGREARISGEDVVLRFVAPELEGLPLSVRLERGTAWHRFVRCAGDVGADLVVMATRGFDSVADRILGSHTERVVRYAPCPVLVA